MHVKLNAGVLTEDFFLKQCQSRVCRPPVAEIPGAPDKIQSPLRTSESKIFNENRESKISIKFPSDFHSYYYFGNN